MPENTREMAEPKYPVSFNGHSFEDEAELLAYIEDEVYSMLGHAASDANGVEFCVNLLEIDLVET